MNGTKDVALVPQTEADSTGLALVVERLASNPGIDVEKLTKVIELQERILAHQAKTLFAEAFAELQHKLPAIVQKRKGDDAKWTFAPLDDIMAEIRPILHTFGFSLAYRTEWPEAGTVRVVTVLTHRAGHSQESSFQAQADRSGSKNAIQALGSSVSYGRRYGTLDVLGLVTTTDDNGASAGKPEPPEGYADWATNLEACADEGDKKKLAEAWHASPEPFRNYAATHAAAWKESLKLRVKTSAGAE